MRKVNWLTIALSILGSLLPVTSVTAVPVQAGNSSVNSSGWMNNGRERDNACDALSTRESGDPCLRNESDGMEQVRSVAELSDVYPSDWAFQAVQTLVERYGIITGYPDGTFRGRRSLSRYEFAVLLRRLMDYAYSQREQFINREDYQILRRLQESYNEILKGQDSQRPGLTFRLDGLDAQLSSLELHDFSTTTKLTGQTVITLTDGNNAKPTLVNRTRLDLKTSFRGSDLFLTQLEVGNNGGDAVSRAQHRTFNLLGTTGLLGGGGGLDYVEVAPTLQISKLAYTFNPAVNFSATVGARLYPRDFIDQNRFADSSDKNFSSSFFMNNPLIVQNQIDRPGGAGAVLAWKPNPTFGITALYIAADAERTTPGLTSGGLFGDRYQSSVEASYALNRDFTTRLQFTHALIDGVTINAGGVNVEWAWNQQFALFGRYGIGRYSGFSPVLGNLSLTSQTWAVGTIIRNIVLPGSTAGFAIGQPLTGNLGNRNQTNLELFYSFFLNDNISVTPGFMIVANPNNRTSSTIHEIFLRMVFAF